jgi:spore maturation protein SpmB
LLNPFRTGFAGNRHFGFEQRGYLLAVPVLVPRLVSADCIARLTRRNMGLFDDSQRMTVFVTLNLIMSVIGTVAASINIAIIRRMTMSGYLLLLLTICVFQFMFDVTFFFSNVKLGYWVTTVANIFQIMGGVGGCMMSNFIALIVFYIVSRKKSFDIFRWYKYMLAVCITIGLMNTIVYMVGRIPENANPKLANMSLLEMNYYIWLGSIFSNFIIFGMSAYCIRATRSMGRKKTEAEVAVSTLSKRLIFYPIVQVTPQPK